MPVLVKRSSGSSTRLPTMVVWLSAAMFMCSFPVLLRGHSGTLGWLGGAMIPAHDHPGRPPAARPAVAAHPALAPSAAIPSARRRAPHRARPGLHGRDHLHDPHLHPLGAAAGG